MGSNVSILRFMPPFRNAHAVVTFCTKDVSHRPHLEQYSFAGNLSGQEDGFIGLGVVLWMLSASILLL